MGLYQSPWQPNAPQVDSHMRHNVRAPRIDRAVISGGIFSALILNFASRLASRFSSIRRHPLP